MEVTELKKDLNWTQIIGIVAIVGLAILIGGVIAIGLEMYFETNSIGDIQTVMANGDSIMIPDWVDVPALIFALVVLIVVAILGITRYRKRE